MRKELAALALLACLAAGLFGFQLGAESLYDWDEAWYGQVVKELLASDDWITFQWRGHPFFDKPPLALWAMAASASLFGLNEAALRLPSAAASAAAVLVLYAIARVGFGRIRPALLAATVLLTTLPFLKAGRMAMLDGPLTLTFSLGVLAYLLARRDPRWSLGIGLAACLTWLIKGPLAFLLLALLAAHSLWERDARPWRTPWLLAGFALGTALALPWYVLEWQRHGMFFVQAHLGQHVVGRALSTMDSNQGPPWFYLAHIASVDHPWLFAFVPAGLWAWTQRRDPFVRLALCWLFAILVPFSVAATKLPWYVVPAYPALALLLAGALDAITGTPRTARLLGASWALLGLMATVAAPLLWRAAGPEHAYALAALVLGLGLFMGGAALFRRHPAAPWIVVGATALTLLALSPASLRWEARFAADLRPLAAAARRAIPTGQGILYPSETTRPAFIYYLDRPEILVSRDAVPEAWAQHPAALLTAADYAALEARLPGARVAASASGMVLLTR